MSKKSFGHGLLAAVFDALFSLAGLVIMWAARLTARLTWWLTRQAIRHPRTSGCAGLLGGAVWLLGWQYVLGIVGVVFLGGSTWKAAHAESFERIVLRWLECWWRRWYRYRRAWTTKMRRCGLTVEDGDQVQVPELRRIRHTAYWDFLTLRMQHGQEVRDFTGAAERLRNIFGAERLAVIQERPSEIQINVMRRDPLAEIVPATAMPATTADIDWTAVPIGMDEYGRLYTISLVGGHTAFMAASGGGKAGGEWNVLRGIAPALADGTCKPAFIDPKGRELRQGLALLNGRVGLYGTKFGETLRERPGPDPTGDYAVSGRDTLALLERLVKELEEVNAAGGDRGERDFEPSQDTPLRLIFVDEGAPLLKYWPRSLRDKIEEQLGIILTQGRAAGFIVMFLIQEPTKDIFTIRDLFPRRVGLRLPTEDHTDAALTDKASDRGALCHQIPESLPGVGYALLEGAPAAVRMRLGYCRDGDIRELVGHVEHLRDVARLRLVATADAAAIDTAPTLVDARPLEVS